MQETMNRDIEQSSIRELSLDEAEAVGGGGGQAQAHHLEQVQEQGIATYRKEQAFRQEHAAALQKKAALDQTEQRPTNLWS